MANGRFLVLLSIGLMGCSSNGVQGKNQLPTLPVSGVVHVDGKPVGPATLRFKSADASSPVVAGSVAADGRFTLMTYRQNDGAPQGKYSVTLIPAVSSQNSTIPEVEPLPVEITKASSSLTLEFKGTGKQKVNPLMVPPIMPNNPEFNKKSPMPPR